MATTIKSGRRCHPIGLTTKNVGTPCATSGTAFLAVAIGANATNRRAPGNVLNHVAGTRSAFRHAKKMKEATGVEPTHAEVFRITHTKKHTGEFYDAKSKEENYIFYKTNPEFSEEGDLEKWVRAAGGVSHGRVYGGVVDLSKVVKNKRQRCERTPAPPPPSQGIYMQEEVDAMILEERRRNQEDLNARILQERHHNMEYITAIYNHIGLPMPPFAEDSLVGSTQGA